MRILIVEDEAKAAHQLQAGLRAAGHEAEVAPDGPSGLLAARSAPYDALLVDVMLPELSGLDLVRRLRHEGLATPVLFLSAKGSPEDRVRGLEEGGDDYLPKPYSFPEVMARLGALLRRARPAAPPTLVRVADLEWDPPTRTIRREGRKVELTLKEYALACLLLEHRGQVVSRPQALKALWGEEAEGLTAEQANALDVQVRRLRAKLDEPFEVRLIHTLRGVGLVLEERRG